MSLVYGPLLITLGIVNHAQRDIVLVVFTMSFLTEILKLWVVGDL